MKTPVAQNAVIKYNALARGGFGERKTHGSQEGCSKAACRRG